MNKNIIDYVLLGKGRMNRRQYLNISILLGLIYIMVSMVLMDGAFGLETNNMVPISVFIVTGYALFLAGIMIRRGHDCALPTYIGIATVFVFWLTNIIPTLFPLPQYLIYVLNSMYSLYWMYAFVLLFYPGDKELNIYGEQPKNFKKLSEIMGFWSTGQKQTNPPS